MAELKQKIGRPESAAATKLAAPSVKIRNKNPTEIRQWHQRRKLVDEFAQLDHELSAVRPKILRHSKLRELIIEWYRDKPPEEEINVEGSEADIAVSARDKLRMVTAAGKQKLFRLWGAKEFLLRAHVQLKQLPDPEDQQGLYTEQVFAGPRHLRVISHQNKELK